MLTGKLDFFFQVFPNSYIYIYYFGIYQARILGQSFKEAFMIFKKILLPAFVGSAFFLGACGGDDTPVSPENNPATSSAAQPFPLSSSSVIPLPMSSSVTPLPVSSSAVPVPTSSAPASSASPTPTPSNYAALASTANANYAVNHYALWKSFHFTTEEAEMAVYPSLAGEFSIVFTPSYVPAGRVIWSNQSGYYKNFCTVEDATVTTMKFRACTVSEGIGYGMLLAYFNNDDDAFVRLWNYTRAMRENHNRKLMPWITASFDWSPVDNSSATDADEDIATALILMYYRTGIQVYLQDALTFINAIWDTEVNPTTKLLYSGDEDLWKGKPVYNLSYFSPVALRLFAAVDTQHDWKSVLDAMYAYMQLVQSKGTGVFPDWSDATATAANPPNGAAGTNANTYTWYTFNKESVRIPWRIAWDYFWYQDTRAAAILKQLNDFIKDKAKNDPNDMALAVNYSWDLSLGKDYTKNTVVSSQWYAAWCATGIAGNTAWFNTCTTGLNTRVPSNNGGSYFADILLTMYSGLLNGLFLRPAAMP